MPGRKIPLVAGEIYHIVNRGVASQPIFLNQRGFERGLETIFYYQNSNPPLRYSFFLRLPSKQRKDLLANLRSKKNFLVEINALCLMPNHIHLLLKQVLENGISVFMGNFTNSYTRYFNTENKRIGPLFQGRFKAVRVETGEQLIHLSRYIHLNPYTSYLIKTLTDLMNYPYSSFSAYLNSKTEDYYHKEIILSNFESSDSYKEFVLDQADYQRRLEEIKHLAIDTKV